MASATVVSPGVNVALWVACVSNWVSGVSATHRSGSPAAIIAASPASRCGKSDVLLVG